jgi:putative membrane protein
MTIVLGTRFLRYGLIAGGLLVADGSGRAGDPPQTPTQSQTQTTADVLGSLHQADQKEIQAGRIAQKDGQSKAVKDYGKMLVKDHTAADDKVAALAQKESVDLVAATPAPGANDMGTMATGPDFDKKFAQEMLDDHHKAIAALNAALNSTADPQLRKLLTDLLPTLEKHAAAAQKIVDAEFGK